MLFQIIRNDIIRVKSDAIVNTANQGVTVGNGMDSAIYYAAGKEQLLTKRKKIGIILPGQVAFTNAFHLDAKYIILFFTSKWNNRGYRSIVWRCISQVEKGGPDCTARTVREDELHRAVLTATNDVLSRKDSFQPILKENIKVVLGEDITGKVEEIDKEIKHRQAELLRPGNNDRQIEKIGDVITYFCESWKEILTEAALKKDTRDRIEDMMRLLDDQICAVTEYSETLTRRLIEKVMVYDEKMVVEFRSGLQIEVDA